MTLLTKQEIFNIVWKGLSSQKWEQSRTATHRCAYRGEAGHKCAIGWLIPDEDYVPSMEGCPIDMSRPLQQVLQKIGVPIDEEGLPFLYDLQQAHDSPCAVQIYGALGVADIKDACAEMARRHGLTVPEET